MTNAVAKISKPNRGVEIASDSGSAHENRIITPRENGAETLNFGNIIRRRCEITPVCRVMCMI